MSTPDVTTPGGLLLVLAVLVPFVGMLLGLVAGGRHVRRIAFGARPPRKDAWESTRKPWRRASRPMSMRNPILSRLVRVNSTVTSRPARRIVCSTT